MSNYDKMRVVPPRDMQGKRLSRVYLCSEGWKALRASAPVPPDSKLMNFDVVAGAGKGVRRFLVLDNYGDEIIPSELSKVVHGHEMFDFNLAIDRASGGIHTVIFYREGRVFSMATAQLEHGDKQEPVFLPKKYLGRLDELRNKKRPYLLTCWDQAMWGVLSRWEGYSALRANLVVDLHFDRRRLQVWGDAHREVTSWT